MAVELARHVRKGLGVKGVISTDDLIRLAEAEGAEIVDYPFTGGIDGMQVGSHLGIRAGLEVPERRRAIAHELAHYLLDSGNQLLLRDTRSVQVLEQEGRADLLAGWLLFGDDCEWIQHLTVEELADVAQAPVSFVRRWRELAEWEIESRLRFGRLRRRSRTALGAERERERERESSGCPDVRPRRSPAAPTG